ncbi:MAG TPA: hypothetical protein VFL80_11815 [Thermoanaerobaculia bacterium]|nr:hypothetical protein [Thermoanaerobaculia bacterium]
MWEAAQKERPAALGSVARIAPASEPGLPLVIHGRVLKADGRTPAPGVIVFAYHTDQNGVYDKPGSRSWSLRGWAKSDAQGRFEFRTIRPGSYPGRRIAAHVHFTMEGPGLPRRSSHALEFLDDPFLSAAEKKKSADAGIFGGIRPVTTRGGVQHVDLNLRIEGARF